MTAFLERLCADNPSLSTFTFATYVPEPKLTERLGNLLSPEEEELRDEAVDICHRGGVPFWDALLGVCLKHGTVPRRFLETAGAHSLTPVGRVIKIPREEISGDAISRAIAGLASGFGLVVSSRVVLCEGAIAHVPMLDFRCPCSGGNLRAVREVLSLIGQTSGVVAESGRSYHFYGTRLLSPEGWTGFMAKALLFAPVTDPRYIAHRLADGECRLRIATSRGAAVPLIVDDLATPS